MEIKNESFSESLLEREYVHIQRVYYPITISFTFMDASTLSNAKNRLIKISAFFERLFDIKMNSPEDNLKVYRRAPWISHILLVLSFLLSAFLPFYFMMFASTSPSTSYRVVTYWMFWVSLLFSGALFVNSYREMEQQRKKKRITKFFEEYKIKKSQMKEIILESLVLYFYLSILFYTSEHIENVLICHVQIIAIVFRFCFKVGRNITLSRNMMVAFVVVALGMFVSVIYFKNLKTDYNAWKGILAIVAAFLGGIFWLKNMEGTNETNLYIKLLVINLCNIIISLVLVIFFFSISELFDFLFNNLLTLLLFVILLYCAFWLKSTVILLYEDLIPTLLYIFEPLCLYFYWELFVRLGETSEAGKNVLWEFVIFFFSKFCFVLIFIIAPQIWLIIEIKRNEVNLEGGKIGMKHTDRDQMKLEHLKLLKKIKIDKY